MQNCNFPWLLYDCFIDWIEIILSLRLVFFKVHSNIYFHESDIDIWKKLIYCLLIFSLTGFFYWEFPRCWTFVLLCFFFIISTFCCLFIFINFFLPLHFVSWDFIVFPCMLFRLRFFTVPVCQPCIDQQSESTWFNWQTAVVWQSSGLSTASQW